MRPFVPVLLVTLLAWAEPGGLQGLGREYQGLRKQAGHFSGGEWNAEVDRWNGRKHQLMGLLREALPAGESCDRLQALMGSPDERLSLTDGHTRWVYLWRGHHDYLFFDCGEGKVVSSDWWMAGE